MEGKGISANTGQEGRIIKSRIFKVKGSNRVNNYHLNRAEEQEEKE